MLSVIAERGRQDAKWGEQNHDAGTWALVLLEELGEWAQEELRAKFGQPEHAAKHREDAHIEAVQVAAVAMAIVECMNRKLPLPDPDKDDPPCPTCHGEPGLAGVVDGKLVTRCPECGDDHA